MEPTNTRIISSTDEKINARIARQTEANIAYFSHRLEQIERRLRELDEEWDVERALQCSASAIGLTGLTLGLIWRRMLILPIAVLGFLGLHVAKGWCPPVPLLRRLGVRTTREIDQERYALKALRGDFRDLGADNGQDSLERAAKAMKSAEPVGPANVL